MKFIIFTFIFHQNFEKKGQSLDKTEDINFLRNTALGAHIN